MKKFLLLYYSPPEAMAKMQTASQDEMKAGEKQWMDWFDSLGDSLVERGDYFSRGTNYVDDNKADVSGKVTGYSMIQAESMEKAEEMVSNHPHLGWFEGCSVEVYEPIMRPSK